MIFQMNSGLGLLVLRLAVAAVFLYHAWPKLKRPEGMAQGLGWSSWQVRLLGLVESLSALALIAGFNVQVAGSLLSLVMVGAIWHKILKWKIPFSSSGSTGWEFDLTLLAANIAIILTNGGGYNLFR